MSLDDKYPPSEEEKNYSNASSRPSITTLIASWRRALPSMQIVTSMIVHRPIAGAGPILARRLFHGNRYTPKDKLMATLLNPAEHSDRREAARLRLEPWT